MLRVIDHAGLPAADLGGLERELGGVVTLEDVVRWGLAASPVYDIVEVVTQDEYTHDVIVRWRHALHVVFDAT